MLSFNFITLGMFLLMFLKGKNNEEEFFVISLIEMKTNDIYYSG